MIVLIDDIRDIPADLIIRDYFTALRIFDMMDYGNEFIEGLYLDHDLGEDNPAMNGYKLLSILLESMQIYPNWIKVVSSNPVGRQNIDRLCEARNYKFNHTKQQWELKSFGECQ